jgi:hypothetical protein
MVIRGCNSHILVTPAITALPHLLTHFYGLSRQRPHSRSLLLVFGRRKHFFTHPALSGTNAQAEPRDQSEWRDRRSKLVYDSLLDGRREVFPPRHLPAGPCPSKRDPEDLAECFEKLVIPEYLLDQIPPRC